MHSPYLVELLTIRMNKIIYLFILAIAASGCAQKSKKETTMTMTADVHSYAKPNDVVTKHLSLNLNVNFEKKELNGQATLSIENKTQAAELIVDANGLTIEKVLLDGNTPTTFTLGEHKEFMGQPLTINIKPETKKVTIVYHTGPDAAALQWLNPQQTAGKVHPFFFTQSEAILARTWIPCQDSPGIRFTYDASITVPKELMAVMSADNPTEKSADGVYHFNQAKPISSYLLALAVGDIAFKDLGGETGVYAEPVMLERSANEFVAMPKMVEAAGNLYGKYAWGRYDVLVLPPSFPFGGMENPVLTFATPTILAGDRSLVSLIAHELAHSWSGNLVTNATWNDFWLNEGFTVYFERRIMEAIEGKEYADMLSVLGHQDLMATVQEMGDTSADTKLKLDLIGRNPDDGVSEIAYEKGFCLLRTIESIVGRERFDAFLKGYFTEHAFQTMTTEAFLEEYNTKLIKGDSALAKKINIEEWIYQPGVPANCFVFTSTRFEKVDEALSNWISGALTPEKLDTKNWSTHEWLRFVNGLPKMSVEQITALDKAFKFTQTGNCEVADAWFIHALRNGYEPAYPAIETFLTNVGRRKFLTPLYKEMLKTEKGKEMAKAIYAKARPNYHYVATQTIDGLVK